MNVKRALLLDLTAIVLLTATVTCWATVQPAWIKNWRAGLAHETNQVLALAFDGQGDLVIGGSSTGAAGDYDYLVLKYDSAGQLIWSSRYASLSNGNDQARAMGLDGAGNIWITGTSVTAKFDSSGAVQWTAPYGGRDIAVSTDGFAYVTGFLDSDLSTVKLSPNGTNEWVRLRDGYGLNDVSQKIVLDGNGDVIVAGVSQWVCDTRLHVCYYNFALARYTFAGILKCAMNLPPVGPTLPFYYSITLASMKQFDGSIYISSIPYGSSFYTLHLDACGQLLWDQGFGLGGSGGASVLCVNSLGETYVTGSTATNTFLNLAFVTFKAGTNGNEIWRRYYLNGSSGGYHRADAMALDAAGNIYVTGQSGESKDTVDWATLKYSPDGTQQWVQRYDGPAHGADQARAIAVDPAGNVYVAGTQTTTNGSTEIVLIKYVDLTSIVLQQDGSVLLRFLGAAGQPCRFQASPDLATWSDIGNGVADASGVATFVDTNAGGLATRFYRMVSP